MIVKREENISDMEFLHRQYFISSLNQAIEWIKESIKYESSMKEIFDLIIKKFPNIKDVRNMNEHDISYYQGKGHKQKDFVKAIEGNESIVSDATSTIILEEGYLIGGRLNLEKAMIHLKDIYPIIESKLSTRMGNDL